MEQQAKKAWTKPFHGVQHHDGHRKDVWTTVTDRGTWAELSCYFPGCGFRPIQSTHDSAEQARAAAESWLASQGN